MVFNSPSGLTRARPPWAAPGVVKIAVYTDGILIPFLFHILRFQVSGVRNDEQRRWHLTPET